MKFVTLTGHCDDDSHETRHCEDFPLVINVDTVAAVWRHGRNDFTQVQLTSDPIPFSVWETPELVFEQIGYSVKKQMEDQSHG